MGVFGAWGLLSIVYVRGICPGVYVRGYMSGGICPGVYVRGYMSGGICPGVIVVVVVRLSVHVHFNMCLSPRDS